MNRTQRVILVIGLLLIAATGVYVPWVDNFSHETYGPLWSIPSIGTGEQFHPRVYVARLVVTWVVIAAAMGAAVLLAGLKRGERE
jgi:hypothetical protein